MDFEQILAFSSFALVASATPGPNNVILMATGRSVGTVRGIPVLAGIALGIAFMIFTISIGLGSYIVDVPIVQNTLKYVGIAFLLWLAWKIASSPLESSEKEQNEEQLNREKKSIGFLKAAIFQWVNPKAWISCASAISVYFSVDSDVLPQALTFSAIFILMATVGCFPWLAFGSSLKQFLKSDRTNRTFNIIMGLLLLVPIFTIIS